MNKKRIYIAGKITGILPEEASENFRRGINHISFEGNIPLDPFSIYLGKQANWKDYMLICVPMLLMCDEIYMLKGWETSKGACIEHALAEGAGMIIKYEE